MKVYAVCQKYNVTAVQRLLINLTTITLNVTYITHGITYCIIYSITHGFA